MSQVDIPKTLFITTCLVTVVAATFGYGLYSGSEKNAVFRSLRDAKNSVVESVVLLRDEATTLTRIRPKHFLQPTHYPGEGVTVNEVNEEEEHLILLSGFFNDTNEVRLIRRSGEIVSRWPVSFSEIFPNPNHIPVPPATDWNVDLHGALALPDGSIVFNFEYSGLVKLDRCGDVVWTLAQQTHHSVERAEGGGFWVPAQRFYPQGTESPYPPFPTPLKADTLLKISDDGEILVEISLPELMYDNGLETFLTASGHSYTETLSWDHEIVHLNKIAELSSDIADDFPLFEAGDLALSIRMYNMVMVVDPKERRVRWWRAGPWRRQHDPEFKAGGTLLVFNNNVYRNAFGIRHGKITPDVPRVSNVLEIDPVTDDYRVVYGGRPSQEMVTVTRGKHELTASGGLLVTEFDGGRVFETDSSGRLVWEYINRYSEEEVAELTEARVYPVSYFSVSDWECGSP